jgi:signal transduction histidine kinase
MDDDRFIKSFVDGRVAQAPGFARMNSERRRSCFRDVRRGRLIVWLFAAQFFVLLTGPAGAQGPATSDRAAARVVPAADIVTPTAADPTLPPLTRIAHVRDLSAREASRGYPVRVTGVLTYYDVPGWKQFLQDDSAGIYFALSTTNLDARLAAGQKVAIEGFSGPGDYAPILHATRLRVLGAGPFPAAKITTVQSLMTGSEDSQWVAIKGVVRSQAVIDDKTVLTLWTTGGSITATVPNATNAPAPLDFLDAAVEVRGVCATLYSQRRQLQGIELYVPDWKQVEVHEIGPKDPFTLPVQPISALLEFHAGTSGLHRSRINGTVTLRRSDGSFFMQDASGGIRVQLKEPAPGIQVGTPVEVVGFPAVTEKLPVLQDAIARPLGNFPPPDLIQLSAESPLNGDLHATLVQFDGRVIAHSTRSAEEILTVEFAQSVTDAILEMGTAKARFAGLVPGSVVRLSGVYFAQLDDSRQVRSFRLLLRSPADVVVISRPPWWTLRHTLWVLGGLAAVLSGALMWVNLLRRQVRRRTLELSEEAEGHKRTGTKLEQQSGLLLAEVEQRKHAQTELEAKQAALEREIEERKQAEEQLKETHKELLTVSRQAGMAEVATNVLHNVGNVLNSVNVASSCLADSLRKSRTANLAKVVTLLREHEGDLGTFLTRDPRGSQLPGYLAQLADHLAAEQADALDELAQLQKNIEHIKDIVSMQQSFAKVCGLVETARVTDLVEDALRMNASSLARHDIEVIREFDDVPPVTVEKHKVLQVLVNLVRNAKHACDDSGRPDKRLILRVTRGPDRVRIAVADNGVGISPENLVRIFSHGFTTKKDGHGFGLHSGALAAREMGGSLNVQSHGLGHGATFTLELPYNAGGGLDE